MPKQRATVFAGFDPAAPIVPGESAAGVKLGQPIKDIVAVVKPRGTKELADGGVSYTFGDGIKLWSEGGVVTQVGLTAGYTGKLGKLAVGATLAALGKLGEVGRDGDENWVIEGKTGVVFDVKAKKVAGIYVCSHEIHDEVE